MTEETPPAHPLADRALTRLRKMAAGNGLEPAAIEVIETQEKDFILTGQIEVSPLCETSSATYAGEARGKDRKQVANLQALENAVKLHQENFRARPDWVAAAVDDIKAHEGQGWGLSDAQVTLPGSSATYAATETCGKCGGRRVLTCTQCNGIGDVICTQCRGEGRELCYYCMGRGEDPQQPGQRCMTCNSTRFAPCRFCQARGRLVCPTCQGKRGVNCPACQASGRMTQETTVTCGAALHFRLTSSDLPSGLRRGIDRIGIQNLAKGHADISTSRPGEEDLEEKRAAGHVLALKYQAVLPYAEMRMRLGNKKAIVSAVGKKCAIAGVPPFLDSALEPARAALRRAALGKAALEDAITARALHDALALTISGRGKLQEFRKLYPFGLSTDVMTSILADMKLAVNRKTLKIRAFVALLGVTASAAPFYVWFVAGMGLSVTANWKPAASFALSLALLSAALAAGWGLLNFSARFALQRHFPNLKLALQQKIGKTGYAMLFGICAAFALCLWLSPVKPLWFNFIIMRLSRG